MPYVGPKTRKEWELAHYQLTHLDGRQTAGVLNYLITSAVDAWLGDKPNYTRFNAAIGVLECAKLELYRRLVAPYENGKIKVNGDVYRNRGEDDGGL